MATSGDLTWPPLGTFSWPWTTPTPAPTRRANYTVIWEEPVNGFSYDNRSVLVLSDSDNKK